MLDFLSAPTRFRQAPAGPWPNLRYGSRMAVVSSTGYNACYLNRGIVLASIFVTNSEQPASPIARYLVRVPIKINYVGLSTPECILVVAFPCKIM